MLYFHFDHNITTLIYKFYSHFIKLRPSVVKSLELVMKPMMKLTLKFVTLLRTIFDVLCNDYERNKKSILAAKDGC